jgi:hypothetical protein
MDVKLRLKSIEPAKAEQELAMTYVASSQHGELELKIMTFVQADLNAAEQEAQKMIEAFAGGLRAAGESSPLLRPTVSI